MSEYITNIRADGELNTALAAFASTCAAQATPLGLTPADVTEINNAASGFDADLLAWQSAKNTAADALTNKDAQKAASKAVVSKFAKKFRANLAITDQMLASLMLPPHSTPGTKTPPTTPVDLVANGDGNGFVTLRWGRNGNIRSTVFEVEFRTSSTGEWAVLGSTTKASFQHQWTAGTYIGYRITASRNGQTSPASTPVVLWETGGEGTMSIAA